MLNMRITREVIALECNLDSSAKELSQEYQARANLCNLLAGAFVEEPSAAYLAALHTPEVTDALAELGVRFDADVTAVPLEELEEQLACEYTTLFLAPGGCAPVESARLTGRFQQEPYYDVRDAYQKAGYSLQAGRFEVFEDQLGVELMFVACLMERAADALERGDMIALGRAEKDLKRFWALHLGRWARGFASLVERAAMHSFYREMAKLLRAFAEDEIAALKLHVDDADQGREKVPKAEINVLVNPDELVCGACAPDDRKGDAQPVVFYADRA